MFEISDRFQDNKILDHIDVLEENVQQMSERCDYHRDRLTEQNVTWTSQIDATGREIRPVKI